MRAHLHSSMTSKNFVTIACRCVTPLTVIADITATYRARNRRTSGSIATLRTATQRTISAAMPHLAVCEALEPSELVQDQPRCAGHQRPARKLMQGTHAMQGTRLRARTNACIGKRMHAHGHYVARRIARRLVGPARSESNRDRGAEHIRQYHCGTFRCCGTAATRLFAISSSIAYSGSFSRRKLVSDTCELADRSARKLFSPRICTRVLCKETSHVGKRKRARMLTHVSAC